MHCLVGDALLELEISSHSALPHLHKVPCPAKKAMLKTKFTTKVTNRSFLGSFLQLITWELDFSVKHEREDKGEGKTRRRVGD